MENNDFRNRLRQHKVTPNQEAWEMMQAMLDSSEDLPEKKKRKRLFFWLWFFGLGFTLLSLFIYQQGDNAMVKNQNYNDSISELPKNTGKTKNDLVDTPNNGNTLNDVENRSSDVNDNNPILNQKDYTNIELKPTSSDKEKVVKSSIDIDNSAKKRQVNKNNLFDKRTDDSISSKASGTNTNTKTRDASSSLSNSGNLIHNSNEKVLLNQESEFSTMIQESNSSPNSEDTKTLNAKTNVEKLEKLNVLNFIKKSDSFIEIHPRKTSKWFAFGQIGYALFNNNPGLNFGGGILYEFDKLLYIESMLSYSYGNEAGIDNGEPRDSEKEIDLGLVINLNFINNKTSRFAFDLGIGYTRYWGTRIIRSNPIIINERSSSGRHLQGGISYHHRINNDIKLGAKFGVVSYDDTIVYFALKFYKRI